MNGIIVSLDADHASGIIMGEDGIAVRFECTAVLAHDTVRLEAGKAVTFDLVTHPKARAVNVCIRSVPHSREHDLKPQHQQPIRYMGFEQSAGVREYRFQRTLPGEMSVTFIVTMEAALFTRHHVALQEGPALCLVRVNAELDHSEAPALQGARWSLTEREMLAWIVAHPAPIKNRSRRPVPAVAAAVVAV